MLSRSIPHSHRGFQPGPRYVEFDGTQLSIFVSSANAQKQGPFLAICFGLGATRKSGANISYAFVNNLPIWNFYLAPTYRRDDSTCLR
jgi:hypothetical protein